MMKTSPNSPKVLVDCMVCSKKVPITFERWTFLRDKANKDYKDICIKCIECQKKCGELLDE